MLNVSRREMTRAYRELEKAARHLNAAEQQDPACTRPGYLVLFYAAECGIKAALMKERKAETSVALDEDARIGHDLRKGLKQLGWRGELRKNYKTRQKAPQDVSSDRLHEAFRYGVELDDEAAVVNELKIVVSWIKERLAE